MTTEELKKLHVITCALEGKFTVTDAATALGLSVRRIKQLKKEVRDGITIANRYQCGSLI